MRFASLFAPAFLGVVSVAFVAGCGGSGSDAPSGETGADAASDGVVPDTTIPGDGTAFDVRFDTDPPPIDVGGDVKPAPSEFCPDRYPPTGTCGTPDQICRYWPDFDAASTTCAEFKCTGGAWVDTHTTTCSAPRETCKGGTACTSPFGCALGHCNTYCMCGVDGVLHCTAHPC